MPVIRKYEFELSFDPPSPAQIARRRAAEDAAKAEAEAHAAEAQAHLHAVEEPPPPPEPTFSAEELQNAERVAYDRGMAEGEQAAFGRIEARLAAATESLGYVLRDAAREQKTEIARIETQAAGLVMLCLNKMFPLCSTLTGTKEIEALIREAFTQALDEPRIVVRCAAGLRDMLEPRVAESAAAAGYEGRLSVIGAPDLPETDCRVEWAAGGISRDVGAFLAATETAIRQAFPAVEVPEAPQPAAPLPAETAPETFAPESKAPEAPETDIPVETGTVESGTAECSPAESGPTEGVKEIKE